MRRHSGKLRRSQGKPTGPGNPERIELEMGELEAILERSKTTLMSEEEYTKLHAALGDTGVSDAGARRRSG